MMTKRDWKKQLKRVRDIADKNFSRADKPEQLDESLTKLEQRIENIKHVCQAVGKKLVACLQLHGVDSEKRSRKLPDSLLSKQFHESSVAFEDRDAFRKALSLCSKVEEQLANHKIFYENNIEKNVLEPLQEVIEKDIPVIVKSRKLVLKQAQEVEALKSRHSTVARQSLQPLESARKLTQAQEDMEEAVNKLELYKDQLATEMYNFHAKEADLNRIFIRLIELQLNYHADATTSLQNILPNMKSTAEECFRQPVFGVSLEDHLRHTKQPIASVLNECITALKSEGLELEGLFRVAGGATKLKKLRAAFDAGMVDLEEYMVDPHCVASALKLYLRELPEPLMTYELYNDWAEAAHCSGEQRISAITNTLKKMRKPHFDNLKFLMQFLSKLADFSEVNKMSASNLAIVVGPNLLWSKTGDGQKILATGVQSAIAETMITNSVQFFGEDPCCNAKTKTETLALVSQNSVSCSLSAANRSNNNWCGGDQFASAVENGVPSTTRPSRSDAVSAGAAAGVLSSTSVVQMRCKSASSSSAAARRFQAQREFLCRRVDSVLVRSWPERADGWHETNANQNLVTAAIHESLRSSRPPNVYSLPRYGVVSSACESGGESRRTSSSKVEAPRATPPKSVHSEMYSTAFALQSLGGDVDCADYLAKVRTLWDSHMEVSRKRTSVVEMSKSCHAGGDQAVTGGVVSRRQLSLSEGQDDLSRSLLLQPHVTYSDPEFGTAQSETASLATPNSTPGRDVNKPGNVKQATRKVDSSDSLSSDSLGADSYTTATNASSISSSDISTATRNADISMATRSVDISMPTRNVDVDLTCLVTPKRTVKKTPAPLPPANESTMTFVIPANVTDMRTASEECAKTGRSDKTKPGGHVEPGNPNILPHAAEANAATHQRKASVETKMILATVSGTKSGTIQRKLLNVTEGSFDGGRKENAVEVKTKDEPNAKKRTRSAVSQAFVSSLLSSGAQRTSLTQPNAACPEQKMSKPMKTTGVQNEAESLPNSAANLIIFNPDARAMTMTRMGKGATKPSTTGAASDQLPSEDFRVRHEEENKNIAIQKFKEEVPLKNRPEQMMKQFQSMPSEGETQNVFNQDSDSKVASEAIGHVAEKNEPRAISSQKPSDLSGVGTLQKGSMKHRLQEAPNSGHHQSAGPVTQVTQPDLHAQCTSELPSPRADGNKDLL